MRKVFKYQGYHLLSYVVLSALLYYTTVQFPEGYNRIWGLSAFDWIMFSWIFAGVFHIWVLLFWRLELYFGKISASMGKTGFLIYRIGFILLAFFKLSSVIPISLLTANTMSISPYVMIPIIAVTTPFILWGLYSVVFYFGINRVFGADHFYPAYRDGTLEKRGIFKYIPNSIYIIVLLSLYHPGLFWQSPLGLIMAVAQHAFVWCHYFFTEKPDMKEIYGSAKYTEGILK